MKAETKSSLRNVVLNKRQDDGHIIVILIYYRHKPMNLMSLGPN
jgi:hypothetical protein